ncbi:MAG: cytidine deaminase [Verrucomicrobiota bacterium]|jgi:cytidine deaminase
MKENLREIATQARAKAYAPYSRFLVGAALLSVSGQVFKGCNVENISFGLTMCAERVCVGNALQEGETSFEAIVIVSDSKEPVMPCGACRQVLAEFSPNMSIISWTLQGEKKEISLASLLPLSRQGILG